MSVLTDAALTAEAATIQNETASNANSADRVGTMLTDIIDSKVNVDKMTYTSFQFTVSNSGGTYTSTTRQNNSVGTTFTFLAGGTGTIVCIASTPVFTATKTFCPGATLWGDGFPQFLVGEVDSTTDFIFSVVKYDGTSPAVPDFINELFEIRVYD